jgi:hypothetical protein
VADSFGGADEPVDTLVAGLLGVDAEVLGDALLLLLLAAGLVVADSLASNPREGVHTDVPSYQC